jgi:hypothetical protein
VTYEESILYGIAGEFANLECGDGAGSGGVFGFEAGAEAAFAGLVREFPVAVAGGVAGA